MSAFLAERRFREIGIRKAFGAEVKNIVVMVSGDLSRLILIAFVLSIPVSVYAMKVWLDTFVYKVSQGVDTYMLAGVISVVIGWATISYQSIRAARTNPVEVLREE
jgi:putative ABC transport system permease protein